MQIFKLCSFHCHFYNFFFKFTFLVNYALKFRTIFTRKSLFTFRAVQIVKNDSWPIPLLLNLSLNTVQMQNVPAIKFHTGLLPESSTIANRTVVIFLAFRFRTLIHFSNAIWLQTWKTNFFSIESTAGMLAWQNFFTRFLHQTYTFLFSANILKSRLHAGRWLF